MKGWFFESELFGWIRPGGLVPWSGDNWSVLNVPSTEIFCLQKVSPCRVQDSWSSRPEAREFPPWENAHSDWLTSFVVQRPPACRRFHSA
jgi:hypothetical protein